MRLRITRPRLPSFRMPSRRTLALIGLGVACYLMFVINQLPAALLWQYAPAQSKQQIRLIGISGTIWSGQAESLYIRGQELGRINWELSPFSLLIGNISLDTRIKGLAGRIEGQFTYVSQTELKASDVRASIHAAALNPYLRGSLPVPVMLGGEVELDIESLQMQRGKTLHVNGNINWQDASIEGVQSFTLGEVKLDASPENGGSEIKVKNDGGPIDINGKLSLSETGTWNINIGLLNRDSSRNDIKTMLNFLGRPDATGRYYYKQTGRFL